MPFPPVVESFPSEEEAFLSSYRYNKHSFDVPWMVGMTSDEGLLKLAGKKTLTFCFYDCHNMKISAFFNNKKLMDDMIKNWDRLLPIVFYYDHLYVEDQNQITQQLNEFYFDNEPFLDTNRDNLTKVTKNTFET